MLEAAYCVNTAATRKQSRCPAAPGRRTKEVGRTPNRKPILLFRLFGLLLLRTAARALSSLLFHDPPRITRSAGPPHRLRPRVCAYNDTKILTRPREARRGVLRLCLIG